MKPEYGVYNDCSVVY